MQPDHAKPAVAFAVLVVLAAATVGSGLSHQDSDGAEVTAAAPARDQGGSERRADRLTPFDPTRTVTLTPRPTSDSAPGASSAGEPDPALASRARRPSRSRTGATGSDGGTGSGTATPTWSPGNGNGRAKGHGAGQAGSKDTPPGHR